MGGSESRFSVNYPKNFDHSLGVRAAVLKLAHKYSSTTQDPSFQFDSKSALQSLEERFEGDGYDVLKFLRNAYPMLTGTDAIEVAIGVARIALDSATVDEGFDVELKAIAEFLEDAFVLLPEEDTETRSRYFNLLGQIYLAREDQDGVKLMEFIAKGANALHPTLDRALSPGHQTAYCDPEKLLLQRLVNSSYLDHLIQDRDWRRLHSFGVAAIGPLMRAIRTSRSRTDRDIYVGLLARLGNEGSDALLQAAFDEELYDHGSAILEVFSDPRSPIPAQYEQGLLERARDSTLRPGHLRLAVALISRLDTQVVPLLINIAQNRTYPKAARFKAIELLVREERYTFSGAVGALIGLLQDEELRDFVQRELRRVGEAAIAPLVTFLDSPSTNGLAEGSALYVLAKTGQKGKEALLNLLLKWAEEGRVRSKNIALARLGGDLDFPVPAFLSRLSDSKQSSQLRLGICDILKSTDLRFQVDFRPLITDALEQLISSSDAPQVRAKAIEVMMDLNLGLSRVRPSLLKALEDPSLELRYAAAIAFGHLREHNPPAQVVPILIEALRNLPPDAEEKKRVVRSIGLTDDPAVAAVPDLIREFKRSDDEELKSLILYALGEVGGPQPDQVIELLLEVLDNPVFYRKALEAIERLGRYTPAAVSKIIALFQNGKFSREELHLYLRILARMGPAARDAIPLVIPYMDPKKNDLRDPATDTLYYIGSESVPTLIILLRKFPASRAAERLGELGPAAVSAAPDLARTLKKGKHITERVAAAHALASIQARDPQTIEALIAATRDDTELDVRIAATRALGRMGSEAKRAIPLLKTFIDADVAGLREAAQESIQRLGEEP